MSATDELAPIKQVCQTCRLRHRKCDWAGKACLQCISAGVECVGPAKFKFRYYPNPRESSNAAKSSQKSFLHLPVRFYDETPDLLAIYEGEGPATDRQTDVQPAETPLDRPFSMPSVTADSIDSSHVEPTYTDTAIAEASAKELLPFSPTEAFLIRNFTDRMAQWTDIADPFRTFEMDVSRLTLTDRIIRYAICAFSARHFYRCQHGEDGEGEALDYQNRCLELLIPAISAGGQAITEGVLTAVAILRQNEEMDEQDNRFHL